MIRFALLYAQRTKECRYQIGSQYIEQSVADFHLFSKKKTMPRSDSKIGAILIGNNLLQKGARAALMVQKQIFYVNDTLL